MGRKTGYQTATFYVKPDLYERVRVTAYVLGEDIYEFANEAFANACERRTTKEQRTAIDVMIKQNVKNVKTGASRGKLH